MTSSPLTLSDHPTRAEFERLIVFLTQQGTFTFPRLSTGLFSAAASTGDDFELTGYRNVWVRDTVHIANAHRVIGEPMVAVKAAESLMAFFIKHRERLTRILSGQADASDPMQRPHIRFDGERLEELPETWAHAQNDAIGYFLWLYAGLVQAGQIRPAPEAWRVLIDFVLLLRRVRYWEDEDSGHWEETRKVAASSIGAATAGIQSVLALADDPKCEWALERYSEGVSVADLDELIAHGHAALAQILPSECVQTDPKQQRRYDAALLFLIYPLGIVDGPMADQIISDVRTHLLGEHGIRRYLGDSYWCADYKTHLAADQRTVDFSDDLSRRDRLLQPGGEAQWCIFDPILAAIFARRFAQSKSAADQQELLFHLSRALGQLTPPGSKWGAYRCPESYYREAGTWVPNDITPLLWTQANLRLALHEACCAFG